MWKNENMCIAFSKQTQAYALCHNHSVPELEATMNMIYFDACLSQFIHPFGGLLQVWLLPCRFYSTAGYLSKQSSGFDHNKIETPDMFALFIACQTNRLLLYERFAYRLVPWIKAIKATP